MPDQPFH